jgi:cold shock CspA family protein
MRALVTALIYFGSFLAIGQIAKLVISRWMIRRNLDLFDIQARAGPNRRKRRVFLLGFWRMKIDEDDFRRPEYREGSKRHQSHAVASGLRGPQVAEVSSTAAPSRHPRASFGSPSDRRPLEASAQEMGAVKWYKAMKGFGFIVRDSGGRDVFVHASALQRAGIIGLNEGQRVFVGIAQDRKGPEAASIQLA